MRTADDDPKKLERAARMYYVDGFSQAAIAQELGGVHQSTVAHWLRRAKERGVVAIDIDHDFALAGVEHGDVARGLRDDYRLRECLVVGHSDATLFKDSRSGLLHTVIANTSGRRLKEWIQSGDHLVVGGGRAPIRVARFIKRTPPARREVRISPLAGRVWAGSWQEDGPADLERPLDADDAARLFGFAFEHEPGTRFSQIGRPLYVEDRRDAARIIDAECVFSPNGGWHTAWGIQPATRALVGVGVVHEKSGHRISDFLTAIDSPRFESAHHLHWAAPKLQEAIAFRERHSLPHFGDVANRLFPALFRPSELDAGALPSVALYEQLGAMLEDLNRHAIVMDWTHLRTTPSVWAVAGGQLKLQALWTLLICRRLEPNKNNTVIKELSTDIKSAETLIRDLKDFERASSAVQGWYERIIQTLFPCASELRHGTTAAAQPIAVRSGADGIAERGRTTLAPPVKDRSSMRRSGKEKHRKVKR